MTSLMWDEEFPTFYASEGEAFDELHLVNAVPQTQQLLLSLVLILTFMVGDKTVTLVTDGESAVKARRNGYLFGGFDFSQSYVIHGEEGPESRLCGMCGLWSAHYPCPHCLRECGGDAEELETIREEIQAAIWEQNREKGEICPHCLRECDPYTGDCYC